MKLELSGVGKSESVKVNEQQRSFKVTLVGVCANGFSGKWGVQYSPDNKSWLNHEDMTGLTEDTTGDLFFNIPYIRLQITEHTAGDVTLHVIQGA